MTFKADYPGAIIVPAHPTNWRQLPNTPQGWVLHTPEEPWDNNESTPVWFSQAHPATPGSTHYYLDSDGDVYQMVQEKWSPIANGVLGKPYPSWANPNISLNGQSLNVEIEGYAGQIGKTLIPGGVQFNALVKLIKHRCLAYGIPMDREHIIGHYQVSTDRTDPGAEFPWEALMLALKEEELKIAGYWTNKELGVGKGTINLNVDFGAAKAYDLVVVLDPSSKGEIIFSHGELPFTVAGVGSFPNARSPHFSIIAGQYGTAPFEVKGGTVKLKFIAGQPVG